MTFPDRIDASWIGSLNDDQLVQAECELRKRFAQQEAKEKKRRGMQYDLMKGPDDLTSAWLRWSMVNNATRARGLRARPRPA